MKEDDKNGEILLRARFGSGGVCHPCPTLATQTPTSVLPTGRGEHRAPAPQPRGGRPVPATSPPHFSCTL